MENIENLWRKYKERTKDEVSDSIEIKQYTERTKKTDIGYKQKNTMSIIRSFNCLGIVICCL
jgi:hypothetical protein